MGKIIVNAIFLVCSVSLRAAGVDNPAGAATSVPGAARPGLIPNKQAFDPGAGNLIVSGNIGGGRHFRGIVPYGSSYYSRAELGDTGSSSVSNFLRRSAEPLRMDRSPGIYEPYFQQGRLVQPAPQAASPQLLDPRRATRSQVSPVEPANLPQTNMSPFSRQRPLSLTPRQSEQILSSHIDRRLLDKTQPKDRLPMTDQRRELEKLLLPVSKDAAAKPDEVKKTAEPGLAEKYQQIREKTIESIKESAAAKDEKNETSDETAKKESDQTGGAAAESLLAEYKTYANLAQARYGQYMAAAEQLLGEGKFYRAADSFALAGVWQPQSGRPYLGQAVSLFAAGEYMSSAYYLSRAFVLDPPLAKLKIDLNGLVPDRDAFENAMAEMETWRNRSNSGELAFLTAWAMWQDGRSGRARIALDDAVKIMGTDGAVGILQSAMGPADASVTMPAGKTQEQAQGQP